MPGKTRNGFPYQKKTVRLVLDTCLPTKWLAVDLETGDVWRGNTEGKWARFKGTVEVEEDPPDPSREGLEVSNYHLCKSSPVGRCEYEEEDACNDDCVHCGEPEERK
jgi:hypothetical protein